MDMAVRVPGEDGEAPGARERGLHAHLGREIGRAHPSGHEAPGELGEPEEAPLAVAKAWHRRRIADGAAPDEVDVQPDLEIGLRARQGRGFGGRGEGHHERGGSHHAAAVRLQNAARHSGAEPEVVGRDDDPHGS